MTYNRKKTFKNIKALAALDYSKVFYLNIILFISIILAIAINALLVNHLNTMGFKQNDLAKEASRLVDRGTELEEHIATLQTLDNIEERAVALGMVAVHEYTFLSTSDAVVAQR